MYFLIFKPKLKFITYTNQVFGKREDAEDFAKRSFKKKDAWQIVPYDKEHIDKYWYK